MSEKKIGEINLFHLENIYLWIKAVLSSAGLAYWTGTELGNFGSDKILGKKKLGSKKDLCL